MLTNFQQALDRYKAELGYNQYWRYAKAGRVPRIIVWLAQHPPLVQALLEDAQAQAQAVPQPAHQDAA